MDTGAETRVIDFEKANKDTWEKVEITLVVGRQKLSVLGALRVPVGDREGTLSFVQTINASHLSKGV